MITSLRVIWLVNEEKKKKRDINISGEPKKKEKKCSGNVEYSANMHRER
jgi:hypothetical protein